MSIDALRFEFPVGSASWTVQIPPTVHRLPSRLGQPQPTSADPRQLVRDALEHPLRFEPLRRAITPEDRLTVVVDEQLPRLAELIAGILDHVTQAGVACEQVTLLTAPASSAESRGWIDDLPEAYRGVRIEIHDPDDRGKLSYLASTEQGRRLYLNRSLIDADQTILLCGRRYDAQFQPIGCEQAVFPALSDRVTRQAIAESERRAKPHDRQTLRQEAREVLWLLGTPVLVQVIEDGADQIRGVLVGLSDTQREGQLLLDERWHLETSEPVDCVLVPLLESQQRIGFAEVARALAVAATAVTPGGRLVLLSRGPFQLPQAMDQVREQGDELETAIAWLRHHRPEGWLDAMLWAMAALRARLYVAGVGEADFLEDLGATPLHRASELQRLIDLSASCLVLSDAHRMRIGT